MDGPGAEGMAAAREALLEPGARGAHAPTLREQQAAVAGWLVGFLAPGYGPHGGAKLVAQPDGEAAWVRSPALALREAGSGPLLAPYVDLAARVHRHAGDQATTAILLCARLVAAALDAGSPPPAAWIDGYRLAGRQAKAWLKAHQAKADAGEALAAVAGPRLARVAVEGLHGLARAGQADSGDRSILDLDSIDIRAEPGGGHGSGDDADGDAPAWLEGCVVEPQDEPPAAARGAVKVLLLSSGWKATLRGDGASATATLRDPRAWTELAGAEDALRRRASDHATRLGVRLVVCARSLDEGLRGRLADAGVAVWTDAPLSALRRLAAATGGQPVARLEDATASDLGSGVLERRRRKRGWMLRGQHPSATLVVPAGSKPAADAAVEDGERVLRAAACVLQEPTPLALPGGGRWQRGLAGSLRTAADAAPGKAPLAIAAAAEAVDGLAHDLLRNAGRDALAGGVLPDADGVLDPAPCVRLAVGAAFETAVAILRLDGIYAKRPSGPAALRGGLGKSGSPKGMPGDIPPLM